MAETHRIELKDGKVKITVTGIKGEGCKAATERLQGLGTTISDVATGEMYESEGNVETVTS